MAWVVDLEFNAEGGHRVRGGHPAPWRPRASRRTGSPSCWTASSISAPSVSAAIPGGRAQIEGNFNQQSATELANVLKYGALPLAFEVSEVSNVSATLGGEQLRAGIIAGIIGLALVVRSASPTTAAWASWS